MIVVVSQDHGRLNIAHLKVDWEHQGRGVGSMLILSHFGNFCFNTIQLKKNGENDLGKETTSFFCALVIADSHNSAILLIRGYPEKTRIAAGELSAQQRRWEFTLPACRC